MNEKSTPPPKFDLGQIVITRGAQAVLSHPEVLTALGRHVTGDWGQVGSEDWQENELSLREGFRLLSAYTDQNNVKFWIITEADRSSTTILLPSEY